MRYTCLLFLIYRWENWGDRRSSFSLKVTELGRWHGQDVFETEVSYGLKPLHFSPADLWCLKSPHKCWLLRSSEREKGRLKMTPSPCAWWDVGRMSISTNSLEWKESYVHPDTRVCCAMSWQLCPTLRSSMDSSPPISSVHGILQARILEWIAMTSSRGSSWLKDWTRISKASCTDRWALYH